MANSADGICVVYSFAVNLAQFTKPLLFFKSALTVVQCTMSFRLSDFTFSGHVEGGLFIICIEKIQESPPLEK